MSEENQNDLGQPALPPISGEYIAADETQAQAEKPQSAGLAPMIAMLATGVFSFIAARKGEHWNLTPEEASNLGEAADQVAALYMPDGKVSPWVGLCLVGGLIVGPRMAFDALSVKKQKEEKPSESEKPN